MPSRARETVVVELPPVRAEALWSDVRRWPSFVEGFRGVREVSPEWPEAGGKLVWESIPGGRGRVTERVEERIGGRRLVTRIFEDQLTGTQKVSFSPVAGGETLVEAELEYELTDGGLFKRLANVLFIRRALSDALARTLRRFAVEAAEDAGY